MRNVTGKITNRGAVALSGLQVRTGKGVARLAETIAPGANAAATMSRFCPMLNRRRR